MKVNNFECLAKNFWTWAVNRYLLRCLAINTQEFVMTEPSDKTVYAAEYMRMSTDHQKYSLDNQSGYIREYANKNGITISHSYSDAGKSRIKYVRQARTQITHQ